MYFKVDHAVFQKLPQACFGVVVARGFNNHSLVPSVESMLDAAIDNVRQRLAGANVKEVPEITIYREAFQTLGFNPNKFMCSIEALVKRILKGGTFPRINSIVDLGNAVSLTHILPIGAHDLPASKQDIEIRFARTDDTFMPFGATTPEAVDVGELVYARGNSIKTRRWIWRQSDSGKITEESSDIFFPIDGFTDKNGQAVLAARDQLATALTAMGCNVEVGWVDKNSMELPL